MELPEMWAVVTQQDGKQYVRNYHSLLEEAEREARSQARGATSTGATVAIYHMKPIVVVKASIGPWMYEDTYL
jgi:hypothetical protein